MTKRNPARTPAQKAATRTSAGASPKISIGQLLRDADKAFNRALRDELAVHGVTYSQFRHLWALWHAEGCTQAELSRSLGIGEAASTAVIESLDRRKLIRRVRQQDDRRSIRVLLTAEGRALEPALTACAHRVNVQVRDGLTAEQIAALFEIVDRITSNAQAYRPAAGRTNIWNLSRN